MTENTSSDTDAKPMHEYSISSGELASTAVLLAVSNDTGTPIEDLPSLTSVMDTEHLDGLCASFPDENGQVSFTYHGYEVTIRTDKTVVLRPNEKG
jgi:hypothetical protein